VPCDNHTTISDNGPKPLNAMIRLCANMWKIKINESKSIQATFLYRNLDSPTVSCRIKQFQRKKVKYHGLTLDKFLTWSRHTKLKRVKRKTLQS